MICGKPASYSGLLALAMREDFKSEAPRYHNGPFCQECTRTPGPSKWHRVFMPNRVASPGEVCQVPAETAAL